MVGWALSHKAKGRWFDSWSGHMPGLRLWSPVGTHTRGNQSMFLSHINVSLCLLPLLLSLKKIIKVKVKGILLVDLHGFFERILRVFASL